MGLADVFEDVRNWRGRREWEDGKALEEGDYRAGLPPGTTEDAMNVWGGVAPGDTGMAGSLRAWHGSPHKFKRFDWREHVGKGEGAQAYGHGSYFAEAPEMAMNYAPRDTRYENALNRVYDDALNRNNYGAGEIFERYMTHQTPAQVADYLSQLRGDYPNPDADQLRWLNQMDEAHRVASELFSKQTKGHLYEVDLRWPDQAREAADPLGYEHLLDWDKPIGEHPDSIRQAFSSLDTSRMNPDGLDLGGGILRSNANGQFSNMSPWVLDMRGSTYSLSQADVDRMLRSADDHTGGSAYTRLNGMLGGQAKASQYLQEQGIPGIQYADKGTGRDTKNFVIFDDQLANILSRNSKPVR